jgi:hypothetical protein
MTGVLVFCLEKIPERHPLAAQGGPTKLGLATYFTVAPLTVSLGRQDDVDMFYSIIHATDALEVSGYVQGPKTSSVAAENTWD